MKKAILDELMKGYRHHMNPKKLCIAMKTIMNISEMLSSLNTEILRANV